MKMYNKVAGTRNIQQNAFTQNFSDSFGRRRRAAQTAAVGALHRRGVLVVRAALLHYWRGARRMRRNLPPAERRRFEDR